MKPVRQNVLRISSVALVLCSAGAVVLTVSEPVEQVATSRSARTEATTGFEKTLELAEVPNLRGAAAVQPLVGPVTSQSLAKTKNYQANLAKTRAFMKKAAGQAYEAAKVYVGGYIAGKGFQHGGKNLLGKLIGRLK